MIVATTPYLTGYQVTQLAGSSVCRTTRTMRESQCSQTVPQGQGRGQGLR